jgi:hypothetical protein
MPLPPGSEVTIARGRYMIVENSKNERVSGGMHSDYTGFIIDLGRADKGQLRQLYFGGPSGQIAEGANHPTNIGAHHFKQVLFTQLSAEKRRPKSADYPAETDQLNWKTATAIFDPNPVNLRYFNLTRTEDSRR